MIKVITEKIILEDLKKEAVKVFGDMVKVVVDIEKGVMAINGELHSDEEAILLQKGSKQKNLWGINLYPELFGEEDWLEFDSMINLRPSEGNRTRGVQNPKIRKKIREIINNIVVKE